MRVWLATTNRGKLAELRPLFAGSGLDLVLPAEQGVAWTPPAETGDTFRANALLKARSLAGAAGGWALADDSGLETAALGGAPGVRSARYAGDAAGDAANVAKLLAALAGAADRRARFVCVLALARPAADPLVAEGVLEGTIAPAPAGANGFGYDPVFVPAGETRTLAEMSFTEKQARSHRARAAERLRERLRGLTG